MQEYAGSFSSSWLGFGSLVMWFRQAEYVVWHNPASQVYYTREYPHDRRWRGHVGQVDPFFGNPGLTQARQVCCCVDQHMSIIFVPRMMFFSDMYGDILPCSLLRHIRV